MATIKYLSAMAMSAFLGYVPAHVIAEPNYSGTYDCKGVDQHAGAFTGVLKLERQPAQSQQGYTAYLIEFKTPGYGEYKGHAVSQEKQMAMYFALTDEGSVDYGTALISIEVDHKGAVKLHKYYYQPAYEKGNFGVEDCVKRN